MEPLLPYVPQHFPFQLQGYLTMWLVIVYLPLVYRNERGQVLAIERGTEGYWLIHGN